MSHALGAPQPLRQRPSDTAKPPCPWCGSGASVVIESRGDLFEPCYRRRRLCEECRRQWFTVEHLDSPRFSRYLATKGLRLPDLGLVDCPRSLPGD